MKKSGKVIQCQTCGIDVYVPNHRFATAKFCSPRCRGISSLRSFTTNCEICGNIFSYIASRQGKAKYCSRKCYYKAMHLKGTIIKECPVCHKNFKTSPSHNQKNCSKKCNAESRKKTKTGGYQSVRRALQSRNLITKCAHCGYSEHPEILGVHHQDKKRQNNHIKNLVVLCPNCHSLEHKKHIP